ncbi:hypothetical protein AGMMS50293_03170 [Spirochaetia bacterium]|nr:hypothetical protein AGMMS50293_03170 [Spirochaetia bacterium]
MGYIILIGIGLYLLYLLITKIIIPLFGIITVASSVIGVTIAFFTSIINYVKAVIACTNPYDTYVDTDPHKPEGVRRSYFFGPGYHQLKITIFTAWTYNKNTLGRIKHWVVNLDLPWYLRIWPWIVLIFCFLSMGIIGTIWTIIFTVLHLTIVLTFMCLIYVLFSALWLLDRLVLALNAISTRCPDCKARCIIPTFICSNCGTEHKKLVPGAYGVFSRRCSCGARLPSTFLNGRSKLEARCPQCGHDLAASNARNLGIQLVGGVKSGKTTFLAAFLHQYLEEVSKNPGIEIKLHPKTEFDEMERWYRKGFSESTSAMNANMYSIVHIRKSSKVSYQLSVYDIAGEVFSNQSASRVQSQYRYCEGIIIVIDPLSSRSVRAIYEAEHNGQGPSNYSTSNVQEVTIGFIDEFSKIGVLSVGKVSGVPVSVIISKADINAVKREIGYARINSVYKNNANLYQSKDDARDAICRDYLCNIGMAGMINNLAAQFSKIHYFPISAMGHEMNKPEAYDPWGIMEPVMWIIKETDQELWI